MNKDRIVNKYEVIQMFKKWINDNPDRYFNKAIICQDLNYGDREWKIIYDLLYGLYKEFIEFEIRMKKAGKLGQGEPQEKFNLAVEMFKEDNDIPPYRYSGTKIENDGIFYPPSYITPSFNEDENLNNRTTLKEIRVVTTKLHNMEDLEQRVYLPKREKEEFIDIIGRMIIGKNLELIGNGKDSRDK